MGDQIKDEVEAILTEAEVSNLYEKVNPFLDEIATPTEEEGNVLETAFKCILSQVQMPAAMMDAFVLGQAWERMMMGHDPEES